MKRILILCLLALASCTVAMAQTTTPNTNTDPKILFSSSMNEYDAGVLRSSSALATKGYNSAMIIISNSIAQLQQQFNSASSQANKAAIGAKIAIQTQLQTDLTALGNNLMGNSVQIQNKMAAFKASM